MQLVGYCPITVVPQPLFLSRFVMARFYLKRFLHGRQSRSKQQGFTLIEVLVSIIIASLIVGGLLYLVVQLLKVDREESVLNQTQQDTRRALDYVSRELQEAIFVYPSQADLDRVVGELSDVPTGATPVVAFWRTDPISAANYAALPNDCTTLSAPKDDECRVLKLRQNVYTLVVYLLQDNSPTDIWEGESRILRYELSQYSNYTNLTERTGYVDPAPNNFEDWEANGNTTNGTWAVLTDSIDDPSDDSDSATLPQCDTADRYERIPDNSDAAAANPTKTSYSFFTCVRDPILTAAERAQLNVSISDAAAAQNNQDMIVYLRGDASDGRNTSGLTFFSEDSSLPTLESRILVRGILDKRPE
ncbi:hypothetical protein C7271_03890 [filamentous cyanobacterium CCP5]|nr:hypothetical protein C7271_03890 [filamentous cyanobacterium CCP5]